MGSNTLSIIWTYPLINSIFGSMMEASPLILGRDVLVSMDTVKKSPLAVVSGKDPNGKSVVVRPIFTM